MLGRRQRTPSMGYIVQVRLQPDTELFVQLVRLVLEVSCAPRERERAIHRLHVSPGRFYHLPASVDLILPSSCTALGHS